jgi:hypothetical protein
MRGQQLQRIHDAGGAGVGESRSLHFDVASPADLGILFGLDGHSF